MRCNKLLAYESADTRTYSVAKVPKHLEWGPEGKGHDNKSKVVCTNGGPLTVLILGEVQSFFRDTKWGNRIVLKVTPLSELDGERLDTMMVNFASSTKGKRLLSMMVPWLRLYKFPRSIATVTGFLFLPS